MPLLVGPSIVTPPPVETTDAVLITWIDPTGQEWPLTTRELGWWLLDDVDKMFGAAPVDVVRDPAPRGGSRVRHVQPQSRVMTLPLWVEGSDHTEYLSRWRALGRAFARTRRGGPGTLRVARPDGTVRQLVDVTYEGGFDGQVQPGWTYSTAVITLTADDPYWQDTTPTTIRRAYAGSAVPFLNPFLTVSSSQTLGATTAANPGEVEAWPTWVITGPASGVTATNNTTGESWTLDPNATGIAHGDLLAGETVTLTTNPATIRGPDGSVWTAAINWPSAVLWGLDEGDNSITFSVSGSGSGTSITLTFHARYETA